MQHSIDNIIAGCERYIADMRALDEERAQKHNEKIVALREEQRRKRSDIASHLQNMVDRLNANAPVTEDQDDWMRQLLRGYGRTEDGLAWSDATDQDELAWLPEEQPGNPVAYQTLELMQKLKRDNPGSTKVSTSFFKSIGYSVSDLKWLVSL